MNKLKLFLSNIFIYGFGGVISGIIPLIMIPVVTRIMPNSSYFAINDLSTSIVSFASAIAICGMYDAMFRLFFDKDDEEYKKRVCSTTLSFTIFTSIIVCFLLILFREEIATLFMKDPKLSYIIYITAMVTLVTATNGIIAAPTRMQNKRKVFLITNTVSPILSYSISIPLLLNGYYTIALPLAGLISGLSMEITFYVLNRSWFSFKFFDKKLLKSLLKIGIPLLPNFIVYWIFNSSDKLMITNMIGLEAAGIYAVGAKLGMCSQLIYTAFARGWQFFAFSTMKEDNQVESNSKIFEYLGLISYVSSLFIFVFSYPIYKILFTQEYLGAYIVAPYLFMAPLLLMLYQIAGNQFLVIKKTWPSMVILLSGAILNVLINYLLIPVLGIEGAAIGTLVGYIVSDIIVSIVLTRMKLLVISTNFIKVTLIMFAFVILWKLFFSSNLIIGLIVALITIVLIYFIYRKEIKEILSLFKQLKTEQKNQ